MPVKDRHKKDNDAFNDDKNFQVVKHDMGYHIRYSGQEPCVDDKDVIIDEDAHPRRLHVNILPPSAVQRVMSFQLLSTFSTTEHPKCTKWELTLSCGHKLVEIINKDKAPEGWNRDCPICKERKEPIRMLV